MVMWECLHDEAILAYSSASIVAKSPLFGLFTQMFKPTGALLSVPAVFSGWQFFMFWQKLLASAAIYFFVMSARAQCKDEFIVLIVVAGSPAFINNAMSGFSNNHGFFYFALALYLYFHRNNSFASGLVTGLLPWSRYEFVIPALGFGIYLLLKRKDYSFFKGALCFPILYIILGSLYHHHPLWMLDYAPALYKEGPVDIAFNGANFTIDTLVSIILKITLVCPAIWLLCLTSWKMLSDFDKVMLACLLLSLAALTLFPFITFMNFNHQTRYMVLFLPFIALLGSGNVFCIGKPQWFLSSILACFGLAALVLSPELTTLAASGVLLTPIGVCIANTFVDLKPRIAIITQIIISIALLFSLGTLSDIGHFRPSEANKKIADWLNHETAKNESALIYTNSTGLGLLIDLRYPHLTPRVRKLVQYDVSWTIHNLVATDRTPSLKLKNAFSDPLKMMFPCQMAAVRDFTGDYFVLSNDRRLLEIYPRQFWDQVSQPLHSERHIEIRKGRKPSDKAMPILFDKITADPVLHYPCNIQRDNA